MAGIVIAILIIAAIAVAVAVVLIVIYVTPKRHRSPRSGKYSLNNKDVQGVQIYCLYTFVNGREVNRIQDEKRLEGGGREGGEGQSSDTPKYIFLWILYQIYQLCQHSLYSCMAVYSSFSLLQDLFLPSLTPHSLCPSPLLTSLHM